MISCAVSLIAGVVWLFLSPQQKAMPAFAMAEGFFFWPFLLLLGFVGISLGMNLRMKVVEPSIADSIVVAALGIYPFVGPYVALVEIPTDVDVLALALAATFGITSGLGTDAGKSPLRTAAGLVVLAAVMCALDVIFNAMSGMESAQIKRALLLSKSAQRANSSVTDGAALIFVYGGLLGAMLQLIRAVWNRPARGQ